MRLNVSLNIKSLEQNLTSMTSHPGFSEIERVLGCRIFNAKTEKVPGKSELVTLVVSTCIVKM